MHTDERPLVLFVDDESAVTSGIRAALRKAPFEVYIANSGEEALAQLAKKPVDIVVSDEKMPGMCGSELLAHVRREYPDTMRLMFSGQADLSAAVRAINEAGIFRFLMKPCDPKELASSVNQAIDSLNQRRRFRRWQEENIELAGDPDIELDRALGTIFMAFQPLFCDDAKRIYAYEALARLGDPDINDPGRLFGLAEAVRRVPDVDTAIRKAVAKRIDDLPEGAYLFVNVHPDSLLDKRVFSKSDVLAPYADRIVLEITERSSLHDTDLLVTKIGRLREMGYRIALDDLGAGYAGLSSFALLTPEIVKFDMELIRGIQEDQTRAKLVESMTMVCREMEILTVAEGIETPEEQRRVLELGCDLLQGYLLARPSQGFLPGPVGRSK